ncbi:MAG TPA: SBBP repeat-containing protein [Acidobacteriaceae bacterium]|nr:SBBP repeat-containing protein [Acidobacteriaceae bacterium]
MADALPKAGIAVLLALVAGASGQVYGQAAAIFSGVQSTVPTGTLNYAYGVAVDSSGNVYVANSGLSQILKETLHSDGTYTESTIGSGLFFPGAIALDTAGNLYIADTDNNRVVKETLSSGTYTQSTIATGLSVPYGIAVDINGNVYVADTGNSRILEETPSGSGYTQSTIFSSVAATAMAVDLGGNLYLCDSNSSQVLKETLTGGSYIQSTIATGIGSPSGLAVDNHGTVFVADDDTASAGRILEEIPSSGGSYQQAVIYTGAVGSYGIAVDSNPISANDTIYWTNIYANQVRKATLAGASFGTVLVGIASPTLSLSFTFTAAGTIGSPAVLTEGATGLDFSDAGTGSCTANGASYSYAIGDSCTVDVKFTPMSPGARNGAVKLTDGSGNAIVTAYASGVGSGPQVSFPPGVQSTLPLPNVTNAYAVTVDHSGNLYIAEAVSANDPGNKVVRETWNGSSYTETVVATGLAYPVGVAVDGAGNVYIADQDAFKVYKETWTGSGYTQSTVSGGLGTIQAVAVDGWGTVYVTSPSNGVVKEVPSPGGGYTQEFIGGNLYGPTGLAVDAEGDVFVADTSSSALYEEQPLPPTGYGVRQIATISNGHGVSLDAAGNVYVAVGFGNSEVLKETPSGGAYTQSVAESGLNGVLGVALDGADNLYLSSDVAGSVWKLDRSDPPSLSFAATVYGSTSGDSPKFVNIENSGNALFAFPVPASGTNPSISPSFAIGTAGTPACPITSTGSAVAATIAAGSDCQIAVNFVPASTGAITGSLVMIDAPNNTSVNRSTQTVQLSGTGLKATPTVSVAPSSTSITTAQALTVNVTMQGVANGAAPTGTATLSGGGYTAAAVTLSSGSASIAVPAGSLAVGTDTLTVTYSGDANYAGATGTTSVTVVVAPNPTFSLSGTAVTITRGATTGNTSTVTVTPSGGFTGYVNLGCAVTTSLTSPNDPPTCGVTSPVNVSGTASATATLTVNTTAATTGAMHRPLERFFVGGGAALAMLVLFGIPARRRTWRGMLSMIAILFIGAAIGCGGGGGGGGNNAGGTGGTGSGNPGTTAGTYTITVTGTDAATGKITATTTVTVTVS